MQGTGYRGGGGCALLLWSGGRTHRGPEKGDYSNIPKACYLSSLQVKIDHAQESYRPRM